MQALSSTRQQSEKRTVPTIRATAAGKGVVKRDTPGTVRPDQLRGVDQTDPPGDQQNDEPPQLDQNGSGAAFCTYFRNKRPKTGRNCAFCILNCAKLLLYAIRERRTKTAFCQQIRAF